MPAEKRFPKQDLPHVFRGCLMGGADIIPGVSGGTVALILGIYERLVTAISRFDARFIKLASRGDWSAAARHVDLRFLAALGCGIAAGIISLASLMNYLLQHQRQATHAVFFGLIFASSILVGTMIKRWRAGTVLLALAATLFAFWLVGLPFAERAGGNAYIFLCGFVAICAMILPGISGAFVLLILGKYDDITGLLRGMLHGEVTLETVVTLVVFVAGCATGLLCFSKFLKWLLSRHETATMAVLCGFMCGSLRKIWPFQRDATPGILELKHKRFVNEWPEHFDVEAAWCIGLAIAAAAFVFILDRLTRGHEHAPHLSNDPPG